MLLLLLLLLFFSLGIFFFLWQEFRILITILSTKQLVESKRPVIEERQYKDEEDGGRLGEVHRKGWSLIGPGAANLVSLEE